MENHAGAGVRHMMPESSIAAGYAGPRGWRPAPLARLSLVIHGACGVALLVEPAIWLWLIAMLAANHLVLTAAVFFPRAQFLGPNVNRLPSAAAARREISLTFDDGPHPQTTPRILELLD